MEEDILQSVKETANSWLNSNIDDESKTAIRQMLDQIEGRDCGIAPSGDKAILAAVMNGETPRSCPRNGRFRELHSFNGNPCTRNLGDEGARRAAHIEPRTPGSERRHHLEAMT